MQKYQARGYLFESLVKRLLNKAGYDCLAPDVKPDRLKGRGGLHQIDAYGKFWFQVPFVYPIRLIAEAKWYVNGVHLHHIRDFTGVIKDISENYFIGTEAGEPEFTRLILKRYTDCGAYFSMTHFTVPAQRYAYAHGIYLITFEGSSLMKPIKDELERDSVRKLSRLNYWAFRKRPEGSYAEEIIDKNNRLLRELSELGSYVGILDGIYPIHILTKGKLRFDDPKKPDDYRVNPIEKEYMKKSEVGTGITFLFRDEYQTQMEFTIPYYVLQRMYERSRRQRERVFSYIDVPVRITYEQRTFRRIFSLKISPEDQQRILGNLKRWSVIEDISNANR